MRKKVVLAFSGGISSCYCAKFLIETKKLEVHAVTVNTGNFTQEELKEIEKKALLLGAKDHTVLEETNKYYESCIRYLIFGNLLKNNAYPLSLSSQRVFEAISVAGYAKTIHADFLAHGCKGKGNDQVRFDLIFNTLVPGIEILTPLTEKLISRKEEIMFLHSFNFNVEGSKNKYFVNKGLWGTLIVGKETLTSKENRPETAFPNELTDTNAQDIILTFEKGEIKAINGVFFNSPVEAIYELDMLATPFGIGRNIHVGESIMGIKGRIAFEGGAPLVIIKAHNMLEKHVLAKWQLYWKEQLSAWYGNLLHEGQFLDPVMRNIERFLEDTQKNVSGEVYVSLAPQRFTVTGVKSPFDLMSDKFGSFDQMESTWTSDDVKGFSKITGNHVSIWHKVNGIKMSIEGQLNQSNESTVQINNHSSLLED
ncbi:MAG: argininosuccinate synthase [Bacteroidetes bacterium]|nr:argininosuccinate synthase [Bacteroidota bacterium]HET6243956.1 argininosuccinate synthase domain-containing protein [Bacteroidia bacterium]